MKFWLGLWPGRQRRHSVDAVFPLGGVVEVPPLLDRSLLVKTLPAFARAGGGDAPVVAQACSDGSVPA